jgi:hypothetical protein
MIDYRLGQMDADEHEKFARSLQQDDDLRHDYRQFVDIFDTLGEYEITAPPELSSKILEAVRVTKLISEQVPASVKPASTDRRGWSFPPLVRELLAAAAAIMIVTSLWLSTTSHARRQAQKVLCASQLGSVGTAISTYATSYADQLPRINLPKDFKWFDPAQNRARRPQLFLLVKSRYVDPALLVCPAVSAKPVKPEKLDHLDDFLPSMVVSYSFQNLCGDQQFNEGPRRQRWVYPSTMAIMADQTPLFKDNTLVRDFNPLSSSPNHRDWFSKSGQNILGLDGSVKWQESPLVGLDKDNIWTVNKVRTYTGSEVPSDPTDSFLAP